MRARILLVATRALLLWLAATLPACGSFATQADNWLTSNATPAAPEINVAGYWSDGEWGDSYFSQRGG